jgi:hypothetical protein
MISHFGMSHGPTMGKPSVFLRILNFHSKPVDILALGTGVWAEGPIGHYSPVSGTSIATPLVASEVVIAVNSFGKMPASAVKMVPFTSTSLSPANDG